MSEPDFLTATRASYDTLADEYHRRSHAELEAKPLERAMLTAFAELVRAGGLGPVADVGCGTGRVTAYLHGLGVPVTGIDLSPGMLAVARRNHPDLRFEEGSMLSLDLPDAALGGVLAWYSTIHVPDAQLPVVFAEFHRVLAPGGYLLLGFQAGEDTLRLTEGWGHPIALDFRRRQPDDVAGLLADAGLETRVRQLRARDETGEYAERTPQAMLLARRPAGTDGGDTAAGAAGGAGDSGG
ncbi:class I SAM-dependent methyltransferase [Streptomyces sp. PLAI1-29]|uniref:Class I SAM-dependent methyltransferase n=1 Tax=Streptomyces zingiberis TaxID=2053010 RepID=A0ABX1C525_9ACTN|nr:class I SAM-dependent methyltransferase [Streptomyces zingiberis]